MKSFYKTFYRTLRILVLISLFVVSWVTAINQVAQFFGAKAEAEQRAQSNPMYEEWSAQNTQNAEALAACIKYNAPQYVILDGVIYCFRTANGNTVMLPLETLRELLPDPSAQP